MNSLYNKIYKAINTGIHKALVLPDEIVDDISIRFHHKKLSNDFNPYISQTVNLNLPSGLKWFKYNLGATYDDTPESWYGNHYAWGEVQTKQHFNWGNYNYCNGNENTIFKYNAKDKLATLEPIDDPVNQFFDGYGMTASTYDWIELMQHTKNYGVQNYNGINGLNGRIFESKTNPHNFIFIPACLNGKNCIFWTSDLYENAYKNAWFIKFDLSVDNKYMFNKGSRCYGSFIRGVAR